MANSVEDAVVILEDVYYQSLLNNRKLLIDNIIFRQEMVDLCIEKKVISGESVNVFKKSELNAERIDCIIHNLQIKQSKYFFCFCEILHVCGQPLISQILQDSVSNEIELNIEDLLTEMPMLKKSLRPKDKEQLQNYILEKIKAESINAVLTHSNKNKHRESIAQVSQIQQSWKFQKVIKNKEKESKGLKEQLMSVEDQLVQKQEQLQVIKKDLMEKKQKHEEELLLSTNFNSASDRELQRSLSSLNKYKTVTEIIISKIRNLIPEEDKTCERLLYESSEGQMKKYDVEKQLLIFQELMDKMLEIFNILIVEGENNEALKIEIRYVQKLLFPKREPLLSDSLRSYVLDYQKVVAKTVETLQSKIDLQDNFIHGRIPKEFIPTQFQNIKVASFERDEYTEIIRELQLKIRNLEAIVTAKEKDFEKFIQHKSSEETEIFLEPNITNGDIIDVSKPRSNNKPPVAENDESRKSVEPFNFSSKYKSRQPRQHENKPKRGNALKIGSVNFI